MGSVEEPAVPQHAEQIKGGHSSSNPFAQSSNITVSVPESVDVRLVDASVLADYEIWSLLTSILGSAVIGFLVAFLQADVVNKHLYGAVTGVFAILLVLAAAMAVSKRRALTKNTKKLRFSVGEQLPPDERNGNAG